MIVESQKGMGGTQTDEPQFGIVDMRKEGYVEMFRCRDADGRVQPQFFSSTLGRPSARQDKAPAPHYAGMAVVV